MTNLEKSELVIARIVQKLMDMGIQDNWELSFKDLGLESEFGQFFGGAIKWLASEGIIQVEGIQEFLGGEKLISAPFLTSRGFAVLRHNFSIDGHEVSAAQIVSAKSNGSPKYSVLGDFLGSVLGGYTKTVNG